MRLRDPTRLEVCEHGFRRDSGASVRHAKRARVAGQVVGDQMTLGVQPVDDLGPGRVAVSKAV